MVFLIPARKGSKRLTAKNLCSVLGRPLIEYVFESAAFFKGVYPTYVSTDDEWVVESARHFRFEVINRPPDLADDKAKMSDVIRHSIPHIPEEMPDICVLYPTNPLRTIQHICEAVKIWKGITNPDATLMSVSPVKYRPYGLMETNGSYLKCSHPYGELFYQDQQMPVLYRANGAIYIIPARLILENKINSQLFNKFTVPYVMDEISGFEIDEPVDIPMAETLMRFKGMEARFPTYA